MQPLCFDPILKRIRWGDRRLGTVLGKPIGPENDYAESWELVDYGDDQSVVAEGSFRGWTLSRLVKEQGSALLGRHHGLAQFPLLVKFIDAMDRLSVQVHPDDESARRLGVGSNGKTESWVILDAQPGSRIYAGLEPGVDRESLRQHLERGTVEECLFSFPARAGDCIFVRAGTVHTIGEGILLVEIQQTSNVTFRLYDWGRLGTKGKPRPLHIKEAMECIDFQLGPVKPVVARPVADGGGQSEEVIRCDDFVLRRHRLTKPLELPHDDRFRILIPLLGTIEIAAANYCKRFAVGATVLVPADSDSVVVSPAGAPPAKSPNVLEAFLP
jgi:mannose-6-phosphate isomerase